MSKLQLPRPAGKQPAAAQPQPERPQVPLLETDPAKGLTAEQAAQRMAAGLDNHTAASPTRSETEIIRDNIFTFFNLVFIVLALCLALVGSFANMTFLGVVIANTIIGTVQQLRSKRTVDGVSLDDEDVHLEVRDRAPTPEEHVEGRETQRLVREGLAALPEDYRRVLVLRELHQLSYAEICEVTELELGTVKSRINRARLLLRNYLAADGNFFEKPASKVTECNQTVGGERNAI